jgi:hypothetical protein
MAGHFSYPHQTVAGVNSQDPVVLAFTAKFGKITSFMHKLAFGAFPKNGFRTFQGPINSTQTSTLPGIPFNLQGEAPS